MKKIITTIGVMLISLFGFNSLVPTYAHAGACAHDVDANFLSFPTWYRGLCSGGDEIKLDGMKPGEVAFIIALNVVDIALRIVGFLAIGYLLYGGFRYVTSRGSPEETKKAQDIILKAIVGLIIAILSTIIVSFAVTNLGG